MEVPMKKPLLVLSIILATLFLFFFSLAAGQKDGSIEKTFSVDGSRPVFLEFKDVDGDLWFSVTEENLVRVKVKKEVDVRNDRKAAELLEETKVVLTQNGNSVRVEIKYPKIRGILFWFRETRRVRVSTEILVPANSNLNCTVVDGSITGEKVRGELAIQSVDGSIRLSDIQGTIRTNSTDGRIILKNIDGRVEAESTDGDIQISGRINGLRVESVDGDVNVEIAPQAAMDTAWMIETVDGDVTLSLPGDFSADFLLQTNDGHIDCAVPTALSNVVTERKMAGKINQGGKLLTIRTGDGGIWVR
jgi:DUF4097 and DUF4098 domain-containing protein YvlB